MSLTYDPGEVEVILGTQAVFGFASGVFVRIEPNADRATPYMGTRGEHSRAMNRDGSFTVTIRTQSTTPANDLIDLLTRVDEVTASGELPLLVRDNSGTTTFIGRDAYLQSPPSREFGDEVTELEWGFYVPRVDFVQGGNP